MNHFDVCIIGAGPAGYAAAIRAWDFGKKVCLIERNVVGGAGIRNGVLFSKTLWELSRDYRHTLRTNRGFLCTRVDVSFDQVMNSCHAAMYEKERKMEYQLQVLSTPTEENPGSITYINASASFVDAYTLVLRNGDSHTDRVVTADYFLIATGMSPRALPDIDIDGERILTSDHIVKLKEFPESLVILGAGVVGCEFACIFANFGKTKVYLIDRAPRILPFEDEDIARICSRNFEKKGITIHHGSSLTSMKAVGDHVEYTISHPTGGRETVRVEKALISVGRTPNTSCLGLEKAGVKMDENGFIVDESTCTTSPHIFAAGDITRHTSLYNVAEIEGRHAVERMFSEKTTRMEYNNLSSIMFLDPEVAAIGLNELQAQAQRIPYRVCVYGYSLVNRAIAMRATKGFIKLLVTDDDEMQILGMRAIGVHASTTIEAASLMIRLRRPARELAELIHPHPAITEALQECVRMLLGTSIYKPEVFKNDFRLARITYSNDDRLTDTSEFSVSSNGTITELETEEQTIN